MSGKKKNSAIKSIVVLILVIVIAAGTGIGYLIDYNIFGDDKSSSEESTQTAVEEKQSDYDKAMSSEDVNLLKSVRDKLIDENSTDSDKKEVISGNDGVDTYVSQAYPSLSEVDRLKLENRILNYVNERGLAIDPKNSFFAVFDIEMKLSDTLTRSGRQGGFTDFENLKYLAKGLKSMPGKEGPGVDDFSYVLANIAMTTYDTSKVEELKKASPEIKKAIEAFQKNK